MIITVIIVLLFYHCYKVIIVILIIVIIIIKAIVINIITTTTYFYNYCVFFMRVVFPILIKNKKAFFSRITKILFLTPERILTCFRFALQHKAIGWMVNLQNRTSENKYIQQHCEATKINLWSTSQPFENCSRKKIVIISVVGPCSSSYLPVAMFRQSVLNVPAGTKISESNRNVS